MTRTIRHLATVGLVGAALVGCSTEPEATQTSAPQADALTTRQPGDLAPSQLFPRALDVQVPMEAASVSMPLPPTDPMPAFEPPTGKEFRETTFFVQPGSAAGSIELPVDVVQDAVIYVLAMAETDDPEAQARIVDQVVSDVQVVDPTGTVLNERELRDIPTDMLMDAPADRPIGVVHLHDLADAGTYRVTYGEEAAQHGFRVELRVPDSEVALHVQPSLDTALFGDGGHITASLTRAGAPIENAKLEVVLYEPNGGSSSPLAVTQVAPGEWRAEVGEALDLRSPVGAYNAYVRATGEGFDRYGWTAIHVAVPTARIAGAGTVQTVKAADGRIASYDVPIQLEVASLDRYELTGTLVYVDDDGTERRIATAQSAQGLDAGEHTLTLSFDAGHIGLSGVTGPLQLRHLTLYSQTQHALYGRFQDGLGVDTPRIDPSQLVEAELTPALELQLQRGAFDL